MTQPSVYLKTTLISSEYHQLRSTSDPPAKNTTSEDLLLLKQYYLLFTAYHTDEFPNKFQTNPCNSGIIAYGM